MTSSLQDTRHEGGITTGAMTMLKKTLLAALVSCLGVTAAHANPYQPNGYLFGSVGQSKADVSLGPVPVGLSASLDKKDTAYKVGAGINLNPNLAVEFQYVDLGELTIKATDGIDRLKGTEDSYGLGANLVGTLPLDDFALFAKVGYHQVKTKWRTSITNFGSGSDTEKEWVTSYGIGAGYAVNESFSIVAEYERYRKVAGEYHVDMLSAGLRYNF